MCLSLLSRPLQPDCPLPALLWHPFMVSSDGISRSSSFSRYSTEQWQGTSSAHAVLLNHAAAAGITRRDSCLRVWHPTARPASSPEQHTLLQVACISVQVQQDTAVSRMLASVHQAMLGLPAANRHAARCAELLVLLHAQHNHWGLITGYSETAQCAGALSWCTARCGQALVRVCLCSRQQSQQAAGAAAVSGTCMRQCSHSSGNSGVQTGKERKKEMAHQPKAMGPRAVAGGKCAV